MEVLERKKDNYASFYFQLLYKNYSHQKTHSNFQPPSSISHPNSLSVSVKITATVPIRFIPEQVYLFVIRYIHLERLQTSFCRSHRCHGLGHYIFGDTRCRGNYSSMVCSGNPSVSGSNYNACCSSFKKGVQMDRLEKPRLSDGLRFSDADRGKWNDHSS